VSAHLVADRITVRRRGGLASLALVADSPRERDIWAAWLAEHRHGGDSEVRREMLGQLTEVRDKVLDRAGFAVGESLLDVGCGEGLIGFGALERGADQVIFSDISQDLLDFCCETAEALGVSSRCDFVRAGADELTGIADASVDVVTTRSVLIYVADKARAFREFFRVLRAGGRVSLYEPINRFGMEHRLEGFWGYPSNGVHHLAQKVEGVFAAIQPPSDPMIDFDERDLVRHGEDAGFFPIDLELQVEVRATKPRPWPAFANSSGNPKIPTIVQAMEQALTSEEREQFADHLRPLVEEGRGVWRMAHAYLAAVKP
jgi:arsenite methyltransferase